MNYQLYDPTYQEHRIRFNPMTADDVNMSGILRTLSANSWFYIYESGNPSNTGLFNIRQRVDNSSYSTFYCPSGMGYNNFTPVDDSSFYFVPLLSPSGYSGYSGKSGYSGQAGQSGYSGQSGQSGYSGAKGDKGDGYLLRYLGAGLSTGKTNYGYTTVPAPYHRIYASYTTADGVNVDAFLKSVTAGNWILCYDKNDPNNRGYYYIANVYQATSYIRYDCTSGIGYHNYSVVAGGEYYVTPIFATSGYSGKNGITGAFRYIYDFYPEYGEMTYQLYDSTLQEHRIRFNPMTADDVNMSGVLRTLSANSWFYIYESGNPSNTGLFNIRQRVDNSSYSTFYCPSGMGYNNFTPVDDSSFYFVPLLSTSGYSGYS